MFILPQHGGLDHLCIGRADAIGARAAGGLGIGQGRHADGLPGRDAVGRLGAAAVHPDLPGAAHLFDMALGQMRKAALEPAVQPLFAVIFGHGQEFDAAHAKAPRNRCSASGDGGKGQEDRGHDIERGQAGVRRAPTA